MDALRNSLLPYMMGIFILLVGCGGIPFMNKATTINVNIAAADHLNPDHNGRPSPVVVRIYELKSTGIFDSADYFSLFNNDTTLLAADLVHREEYNLQPGEQKTFTRKPSDDAHFLAVMVAYRNSNQAIWKHAKPITPKKETNFQVILGALSVSILSDQ